MVVSICECPRIVRTCSTGIPLYVFLRFHSILIHDTGRSLLNIFQLISVASFSIKYTLSFLSFLSAKVPDKIYLTFQYSVLLEPLRVISSFPLRSCRNRTLGFSCFYNQFRIGHPRIIPQTAQHSLFQVTYMVIYPAIILAR